jgi:transcriptional regulator with XRE-family HTH domain
MPNFKYAKLRGRIKEKFGTQGNFAKALGISQISVSRKLTGKVAFSSDDIEKWCKLLEIPIKEAGLYFFA